MAVLEEADAQQRLSAVHGRSGGNFRKRVQKLISWLRHKNNGNRNVKNALRIKSAEANDNSNNAISSVLRMTSGDGECSYQANSSRQASVFREMHHSLLQILRSLSLPPHTEVIRVVDLGCATGMNAISEIDFVVKTLRQEIIKSDKNGVPELQVFFNDLPSNDFNHLFSLLQHHQRDPHPSFFASGVPFSFYQILFPRQSMQVAFSMMALHWLSTLPPAVLDRTSMTYNRGRSWIDGGNEAVARAYAEQSQKDLRSFFRCRAAELCRGGVLWVCMMGRSDSSLPTAQVEPKGGAYCGPEFDAAWDDILSEGLTEHETRDKFNLPWYFPSAKEVGEVLKEEKSWEILQLEVVKDVRCMDESDFSAWVCDPQSFGVKKSSLVRSFIGSMIEEAVGFKVSELFFERLATRSTEFLEKGIIRPTPLVTVTVVGLRRK